MTVLARLAGILGWRGLTGMLVGALVASVPAYQAGKWAEGVSSRARNDVDRLEAQLQQVEAHNARLDRALAARREAARGGGDGAVGGGVSDDGYRRD